MVLAALGPVLDRALDAADRLEEHGVSVTVFNARFAKPVDPVLPQAVAAGKTVVTLEDHYRMGGFGSAVLEAVAAGGTAGAEGRVLCLGVPDTFVPAAERASQLDAAGMSIETLVAIVLANCDVTPKSRSNQTL